MIEITEKDISISEVLESVRCPKAGAVVVFVGTVRADPEINGLELESYKEMALEKLKEIQLEAKSKFSILESAIVHRIGKMAIGENIVVIAVSSAHRSDAFSASRFLIDELKVTTPIWKKELGGGDDKWVSGGVPMQNEQYDDPISGMVDISEKDIVRRTAVAEGFIELSQDTLAAVLANKIKKGNVLEAAKITAMSGVKQTPNLIPHCHPIPITGVDVDIDIQKNGIKVRCSVKADYKTGVEMEALTGVNCALLTIWDMVKYLEKDNNGQYPTTRIHDIRVILKEKVKK